MILPRKNWLKTMLLTTGLALASMSVGCMSLDHYKNYSPEQVIVEIQNSTNPIKAAENYRDSHLHYATRQETYENPRYTPSFSEIHKLGKADCFGTAIAMATLLNKSHGGYLLSMRRPVFLVEKMITKSKDSSDEIGHVIYVYRDKNTKKWGALGIVEMEDRKPIYNRLEDLAASIIPGWLPRESKYVIDISWNDNGLADLASVYPKKE